MDKGKDIYKGSITKEDYKKIMFPFGLKYAIEEAKRTGYYPYYDANTLTLEQLEEIIKMNKWDENSREIL